MATRWQSWTGPGEVTLIFEKGGTMFFPVDSCRWRYVDGDKNDIQIEWFDVPTRDTCIADTRVVGLHFEGKGTQ